MMRAGTRASFARLVEVPLVERSFELLRDQLSSDAWDRLEAARERGRLLLDGRTVWWVNSAARGGGVAEMQRTLLPYWRGSGIDARWLVAEAPGDFFRLTKRLHNLLHGVQVGSPSLADRALFEQVSRALAADALVAVAPGDVVILQDPQTAGLTSMLRRAGAIVVWRCHVGTDRPSEPVHDGWGFLLPYLREADGLVFTRREYVPPGIDPGRTCLLAPAIDPCSAKNRPMAPEVAQAILQRCGLARAPALPRDVLPALSGGLRVRRRATVLREGPAPRLGRERLVAALARWDRLKDPVGTIRAFAEHVEDRRARLILAGPATGAVADDPEARGVLRDARRAWQELPKVERRRIQLASLPMVDVEENALIVNALQRSAAVVVKKSLQEGFGLGVTEAMWKARPVVATRVGGHQAQIEHRKSGLLVGDPSDLAAFGAAVYELLQDPREALELGAAGREHVRGHYLADRHFVDWVEELAGVLARAGLHTGSLSRSGGAGRAPRRTLRSPDPV
jgi:trehalose synthase